MINCSNILEASLYPWTQAEFFSKIYQKKALVIKGQPKGRFDQVIAEQMFDLKLAPMVEAACEYEDVFIWTPPKISKKKTASNQ